MKTVMEKVIGRELICLEPTLILIKPKNEPDSIIGAIA